MLFDYSHGSVWAKSTAAAVVTAKTSTVSLNASFVCFCWSCACWYIVHNAGINLNKPQFGFVEMCNKRFDILN